LILIKYKYVDKYTTRNFYSWFSVLLRVGQDSTGQVSI